MSLDQAQKEKDRVADLQQYNVLDTEPEEPFERITRVAKSALNVPIVLVSLIDSDRQWFKSRQGLEATETPREISFCTHAIRQDDAFVIPNALEDKRFATNPLVTGDPNIRFYVGIPLKTPRGNNIGTLCAIDTKPREIQPLELIVLQDLARLVVDELELRQIAMTDSLTGAHTRRSFDLLLDKEMARAKRYTLVMSAVAFDVDHFKQVNDRYGHAAGDKVLQSLAQTVKSNLRENDVFARIGGEEFIVLLPETGLSSAMMFAERIRKQVEATQLIIGDDTIAVTSSFGIATYTDNAETKSDFLERADQALYDAKEAGRNRIAVRALRDLEKRIA